MPPPKLPTDRPVSLFAKPVLVTLGIALGNDLYATVADRVHRRLRPEFVRRWIGNPKSVLPYTGMPVNIPYNPGAPGIPVKVYDGTSVEQLEALVDLIVNFDFYTNAHTRIAPLVQPAPASAAAAAPTATTRAVAQTADSEN